MRHFVGYFCETPCLEELRQLEGTVSLSERLRAGAAATKWEKGEAQSRCQKESKAKKGTLRAVLKSVRDPHGAPDSAQ